MAGDNTVGARGEEVAAAWLCAKGFTIVGRNVRVGRLELDIIAARNDLLIICEVRSRTSRRSVAPEDTINRAKTERVREATLRWLRANRPGTRWRRIRLDVAAVDFENGQGRVAYYENAM